MISHRIKVNWGSFLPPIFSVQYFFRYSIPSSICQIWLCIVFVPSSHRGSLFLSKYPIKHYNWSNPRCLKQIPLSTVHPFLVFLKYRHFVLVKMCIVVYDVLKKVDNYSRMSAGLDRSKLNSISFTNSFFRAIQIMQVFCTLTLC